MVDASVVIKWFLPEVDSEQAEVVQDARLFAPDLLVAEITNALWRRVTKGDLLDGEAKSALVELAATDIELSPTSEYALHALDLSLLLNHPAYDCFYLALAEQLDIRLVTADTRLINKLASRPTLATLIWTLPQAAAAIAADT